MSKCIIVLGSAGSGKTTLLKQLHEKYDVFGYFKWVNIDFFVEQEEHEFYNNPLKASNHVKKVVIPSLISYGKNFIWDCTGANIKPIQKLIEDNPQYEFKIIIHYCEPVTCYLRNLNRKRTLPKQVVIENWLKVYSQIRDYTKLVGTDNIYIHESDYTNDELDMVSDYQHDYILDHSKDNDTTSSFKKEDTVYSKEELNKKQQKFITILNKLKEEYLNIDNEITTFNDNFGLITLENIEKSTLYKWILI
jgi:predicted kinase